MVNVFDFRSKGVWFESAVSHGVRGVGRGKESVTKFFVWKGSVRSQPSSFNTLNFYQLDKNGTPFITYRSYKHWNTMGLSP